MKKSLVKAITLTAALSSAAVTGAFAQEDSFADFGSGFDDFGSFGDSSSSSPSVSINGNAGVDMTGYVDPDNYDSGDEIPVEASPYADLTFGYSGASSDASLTLKFDEDTILNHPEDVINQLVIRGYFGNFQLEGGKMTVVWGKGDKLHVLDNFNADDYSYFIIPDYLDRRISTPMVRAAYSFPVANLSLEGIYTPFLPVDRFSTTGRWTPEVYSSLNDTVTTTVTNSVATAFSDYTTATATAGATAGAYAVAQSTAASAQSALTAANSAVETATTSYNSAYTTYVQAYTAYMTEYATSGSVSATTNKSYSDAMAALAAATAAKETAETTAAGYEQIAAQASAAEAQAQAAYEAAVADLTSKATVYMTSLTAANALIADPDMIYPDMDTLKYGQYGARLTGTFGSFDWGVSYYNGYFKQPSYNASKLDNWVEKYLAGTVTEEDKFLAYDKKQTVGLEAATTVWHFNLRGEAGYNFTDDMDGTNPYVHNNSICWLGGFDIDLPFWNLNLNVQETGTYVLHGDVCDTDTTDVDYDVKGYSNNKIVANISASFDNDKIVPEVTVLYGIERADVVVLPKLSYKPSDGLTLAASGMYIYCGSDDSEFAEWKDNSFVTLSASYKF